MRIEQGTAHQDVPHKFEAEAEPNEQYMAARAVSHVCRVCFERAGAAVHARWNEMNAASRESASQQIPRVHG
jgi:hypothetical protein